MNQDYSELIKYLDEKFTKIDIEITNLRGEVVGIREGMATKVEINKLVDVVDAYMKQGEDYRQEMLMLGHKVDRHEKWIEQIAEKLGIKLEH